MSPALLLGTLVAGAILGWLARGWWPRVGADKVSPSDARPGDGIGTGADPVVDWALRAIGGTRVWIQLDPAREPHVHGAGGAVTQRESYLVAARLPSLASAGDGEGVERLGDEVLLWVARPPAVVAVSRRSAENAPATFRDLTLLLQHCLTRPILRRVEREQDRPGESVESIAVRLAHQLEELCQGDTLVVLKQQRGVEVAGVALRGDTRLLHARVMPGTAADRVARGEEREMVVAYDPVGIDPGDRRRRERRSLVYPIRAEGETVGAAVLWPAGGEEPAGPAFAALRGALEAAGPRFHAALARREEQDQAVRDPLTGLHNRRGFEAAMQAVGVVRGVYIAADLDHFKQVNDTLGHAAGDAALVHFAVILERLVRGRDVSGRVGGEEFAIWLPDQDLAHGCAVAERVREALAETVWAFQGTEWPLTASFGVAAWPGTTNARENLAAQADAALYRAKEGGRNCVRSG